MDRKNEPHLLLHPHYHNLKICLFTSLSPVCWQRSGFLLYTRVYGKPVVPRTHVLRLMVSHHRSNMKSGCEECIKSPN